MSRRLIYRNWRQNYYTCMSQLKSIATTVASTCMAYTILLSAFGTGNVYSGDLRPGSNTFILFFDVNRACCWT